MTEKCWLLGCRNEATYTMPYSIPHIKGQWKINICTEHDLAIRRVNGEQKHTPRTTPTLIETEQRPMPANDVHWPGQIFPIETE